MSEVNIIGNSQRFLSLVSVEKKSFAFRLYHLIDSDEAAKHIIEWLPNGDGFHIVDVERFTSELAPLYFKHKKLTSFQRQLNLYGFRRFHTIGIAASYFHANFQRGRLDLLGEVKRLTTAAKRELPLPPKIDRRKRTVSKKQLARMKTSKTALSTLSMHKFSLSNDEVSELSSSKSRIEPKPSLWVDRTPWLSNDSSFESLETTEALSDLDIQSLENVSSSNTMLDSVEFTEDIFSELLTMYDCDDQYSHSDSEKPEYMFYHKIVVDGEIFFVPYTGPELDRIVLPPPAELIHFENSHYLCNIASSKLF